MTALNEAQLFTENREFEKSKATWPHVAATEVTESPRVGRKSWRRQATSPATDSSFEDSSVTEAALDDDGAVVREALPRRPLVFPPEQSPQVRERFQIIQDWEGVVEEVREKTFNARLRDRTAGEAHASEMVDLPMGDVSEDDRALLQPGGVFYLSIGYLVRASGRRDRVGRIVFRRLPAWTASTLDRAKQRAERLTRFLNPSE